MNIMKGAYPTSTGVQHTARGKNSNRDPEIWSGMEPLEVSLGQAK